MPAIPHITFGLAAGVPDSSGIASENEDPIHPPAATPAATGRSRPDGEPALPNSADQPGRLIIKNAEMQLLVADSPAALDRVTQIVADMGGYILSSQSRYQEQQGKNYLYVTLTIRIPADQFEATLRSFRQLSLRVLEETAWGQDVTEEYVDLKSRLTNLEATRGRIRQFLAQAQSVEEALKVNTQLAAIEEQIEQTQGRINYLRDRAAYSTMVVTLNPDLPPNSPPTPSWNPLATAREASVTLSGIMRTLGDGLIWLTIVLGPFAVPALFIYWRFIARRGR